MSEVESKVRKGRKQINFLCYTLSMARTTKRCGYIYFLLADKYNAVKIGFTRNTVEERLVNGNTWSPYEYDVLKVIKGTMLEESQIHHRFVSYKIRGEWFTYSDEIKYFISQL